MADWEHKEENYISSFEMRERFDHWYYRYEIKNNLPLFKNKKFRQMKYIGDKTQLPKAEKEAEKIKKWYKERPNLTLVEFLDLHCSGGWEVFKIWHVKAANSQQSIVLGQRQRTRCLFRRRKNVG